MKAREKLTACRDALLELDIITSRADVIRTDATESRAIIERAAGAEIDAARRRAADAVPEVHRLADMLTDAVQRQIIKARYADLLPWDAVTACVYGGASDFIEKAESYRRRVYRYHNIALEKLDRKLAKNGRKNQDRN